MRTRILSSLAAALCCIAVTVELHGQGTAFSYSGQLTDNGRPANGTYNLRFAIYDAASTGNQIGPTLANIVATTNGLFTVSLNFGAIFTGAGRWLEIGARTNGSVAAFTPLLPRQQLLPTPYAIVAGTVPTGAINDSMLANGSVTAAKIASGAITGPALANNTVGSAQLADVLELGSSTFDGRLDVFRTTAGTAALRLDGPANSMFLFGDDGGELGRFVGQSYGLIELRDSDGHQRAVQLTANGDSGGVLTLYNSNGVSRARLSGENIGGALTLYQADGTQLGAVLDGYDPVGAGRLDLRNTNGAVRALLQGGPAAGSLSLYQSNGAYAGILYGTEASGGALSLRMANGANGVLAYGGSTAASLELYNNNVRSVLVQASETTGAGGQILMYNGSGAINTVEIDAQGGAAAGGYIGLRDGDGIRSIELNSDTGIVKGRVIQITGGADLSENFDISGRWHEPGMIVSIDPANPGRLVLSSSAYDKRVAGIISGAGGVQPGMLMGQHGSIADGKHPVALTGRVYCWVDADAGGAVEPGDMLTTSNTIGHAMKVTDSARATGTIIGKAMTGLDRGKGLVLVLVSLQ